MFLAALLSACLAFAGGGFFLESGFAETREALATLESAAAASGMPVRVVKRFRLGRGWAWVALVEGFSTEAQATEAARALAARTGATLSVVAVGGGGRTPVVSEAPTEPGEASRAPTLVAAAVAAHGGPGGGAAELARAPAVHFVFRRKLEANGTTLDAAHDYWREAASRRLAVSMTGPGESSELVVTGSGGWLRAGGQVVTRDIGVLVNQADAFAPEAVLSLALDVPALLSPADGAALVVLEGAERGVRVGRGEDPPEGGLAFADLDPATGFLLGARYITEGGPVLFALDGWTVAAPGVVFPASVRMERPDGRVETLSVSKLEIVPSAPAGTFNPPASPP